MSPQRVLDDIITYLSSLGERPAPLPPDVDEAAQKLREWLRSEWAERNGR
jgi:hypothetical protein